MARQFPLQPDVPAADLVPVYVPTHVLPQVYELLGRLLIAPAPVVALHSSDAVDELALDAEEVEPSGSGDRVCPFCGRPAYRVTGSGFTCRVCGIPFHVSEAGVLVDADNGVWSPAMLERLREQLHAPLAAKALDVVAQRSPRPVGYGELLRETGSEPNQLRAELAVLTRTTRRLFGRKTWPMTARQGSGASGDMGYRMPPEVAHWWRSLGDEPPEVPD